MAAVCAVMLKTSIILLDFFCFSCLHQPRSFIPDDSNFGLLDINDMNIIVKERFLSDILNVHNQTKKAFSTKLSRFSYLFMLLLLSADIEICPGPQNTSSVFSNSRGFRIVHQNVRCMLSNHHLLKSFVNKTESKIDVICKSETHIKDGDMCDNSSLYSLAGYVFLQRNRNVGTGGGVGIILKYEIKFKRRYDLENHLEILCIKICLKN